jgi:prepilin-type N-terminal cleavage/methylation domain-containing protein
MKTQTIKTNRGFSLLEVTVGLAVIGVIAASAVSSFSDFTASVKQAEAQQHARQFKVAVDVYQAFGGEIPADATPGEVMAKLKSKADDTSAQQVAGLTGSFINQRMNLSEAMVENLNPQGLVGEGEQTTRTPVQKEARKANLKLATEDSWIWDYNDTPKSGGNSGPTSVALGGSGIGNGAPGGTPPGGVVGGTGADTTPLEAPSFSRASGEWPITEYNLEVELSDPNPGGVSEILYSVDNGAWEVYAGAIEVGPASELKAYAKSIDALYTDSDEAAEAYAASAVELSAPSIQASASQFDFEGEDTDIAVEIVNEDDSSVSSLEYRVNGDDWQAYSGVFALNFLAYLNGANVEARAVGSNEYYLTSGVTTEELDGVEPRQLNAPSIYASAGQFDYDANRLVMVMIEDDNPSGQGRLEYRVDEANWVEYTGTFTVDVASHQTGDAVIEARVRAEVEYRLDSDVVATAVLKPAALFDIDGEVDAEFINPTGGNGMVTSIENDAANNTTYFEWGESANSNAASWMMFEGQDFLDVSPGERFLVGTLDYYNGTIWSGTEADSVQLLMELDFYDATTDATFSFSIDLMNTVNNTQDAWASADYVHLQDMASDTSQAIQGRDYHLKLEFGETTEDGFSTIDQFHVLENSGARGWMYATLWMDDLD